VLALSTIQISRSETTKEMNLAFAISFSFVWSLLLLQSTRAFFSSQALFEEYWQSAWGAVSNRIVPSVTGY
jgi:hypothetical protein